MDTLVHPDLASELRYALDVLDEHEHLGLDEQYANTLREILTRRIAEADETLSCCPAQPVRFPVHSKLSA